MTQLKTALDTMVSAGLEKLIISKPMAKSQDFQKIVVERHKDFYQVSKYTKTQVFHENQPIDTIINTCITLIDGQFLQLNGFSDGQEHMVLLSKKGGCTYKVKSIANATLTTQTHNRKKQYLLEEGTHIPPLVDMGIFTKEGKIVQSMYHKYKQINRFLEIIDDAVKNSKKTSFHIIDFGCGKSYLTFVVYYYLTQIRKMEAHVLGLDLKEEVIKNCNIAAKKYGYDNLTFAMGDIRGFAPPFAVDMVLTLHACDTATDYALHHAIGWKADMIFSVPCCQHELNGQMKPQTLDLFSQYGLIQERFAALTTDAIRGNLLTYSGYKTQLLEFVDLDSTPKNLLIRAVRSPLTPKSVRTKALQQVETVMAEFHVKPTLYELLELDK
ncbi:SAM-dependent methyltransferase [Bengtsoniella intestinalis]|uniref:class I SAM-dependent methyltransferase n=1 Tax=Bengtsoniella intestinalis TaxID=3073143 RepID=UPI00391FB9F5